MPCLGAGNKINNTDKPSALMKVTIEWYVPKIGKCDCIIGLHVTIKAMKINNAGKVDKD